MKNRQTESAKTQLQNDHLWKPLDTAQSQSISGGLVLLFGNPFAGPLEPKAPGLSGQLGIGG